jgi:predicted SAM-dependent methyltransferase
MERDGTVTAERDREHRAAGLRLNLGSGSRALEGFTNVDALADAPGVDVVADLSERLPFADGEADLIYAAHVLEHFPTDVVPGLLADWRRVLHDGGVLLVAVPDLDVIAKTLVDGRPGWFTPPHSPWLGAIYGGQKDEYDFHKTGFTGPWLASLLTDAGFGAVERVERFREVSAADTSYSPVPFGVNLSLNMRAVAGAGALPGELFARTATERLFDGLDKVLLTGMVVSTRTRSRLMSRRRCKLEQVLGDTRVPGGAPVPSQDTPPPAHGRR